MASQGNSFGRIHLDGSFQRRFRRSRNGPLLLEWRVATIASWEEDKYDESLERFIQGYYYPGPRSSSDNNIRDSNMLRFINWIDDSDFLQVLVKRSDNWPSAVKERFGTPSRMCNTHLAITRLKEDNQRAEYMKQEENIKALETIFNNIFISEWAIALGEIDLLDNDDRIFDAIISEDLRFKASMSSDTLEDEEKVRVWKAHDEIITELLTELTFLSRTRRIKANAYYSEEAVIAAWSSLKHFNLYTNRDSEEDAVAFHELRNRFEETSRKAFEMYYQIAGVVHLPERDYAARYDDSQRYWLLDGHLFYFKMLMSDVNRNMKEQIFTWKEYSKVVVGIIEFTPFWTPIKRYKEMKRVREVLAETAWEVIRPYTFIFKEGYFGIDSQVYFQELYNVIFCGNKIVNPSNL